MSIKMQNHGVCVPL